MADYLSYQFEDTEAFINTFDELPLWSAPFGLLLFKHLELKRDQVVVDIGSGAGFPLTELASRMGSTCKVYGIDPWTNANTRARQKLEDYKLSNVEIIECSASQLPFSDSSVDLIVSNLGINNFEQPDTVFKECLRVLKATARLVLTTNLNGHWKEFYNVFKETLKILAKDELIGLVEADEAHRGTLESISKLYLSNGLQVTRHFEDSFEIKFIDGTAFLNHHFVKLGWLGSWKALLPESELHTIFDLLERNLNEYAAKQGCLRLTVPIAYVEGTPIM